MNIIDNDLQELITAIGTTPETNHYPIAKLEAHVNNVPHVAISIFVFRNQKLLLQQRAATKYHSGGLWANTVCSHPRWQENALDCATRRLQEELGWSVPLQEFAMIDYAAPVGELYENEQVHCFFGHVADTCPLDEFNRSEVTAVGWFSIAEIVEQIAARPQIFTEWFKIYMAEHRETISSIM